jgi:hypothetical protein
MTARSGTPQGVQRLGVATVARIVKGTPAPVGFGPELFTSAAGAS